MIGTLILAVCAWVGAVAIVFAALAGAIVLTTRAPPAVGLTLGGFLLLVLVGAVLAGMGI